MWAGVNVPGSDKTPDGIAVPFARGVRALRRHAPALRVESRGYDALGPWAVLAGRLDPFDLKRSACAVETRRLWGRLIDLDVLDASGQRIERTPLDLPARRCLVCPEPARECARLQRHALPELIAEVGRLVLAAQGPARLDPEQLAVSLVSGARAELSLTPKPGLVDCRDCGSHPDLSFDAMVRAIDTFPAYFDELIALRRRRATLAECVAAGRRAEQRMAEAACANTHRGFIFLSGLLLMAACDTEHELSAPPGTIRRHVSRLAREFFARRGKTLEVATTHGSRARATYGVSGIVAEALDGLPSVFDIGLPVFVAALDDPVTRPTAPFALMAAMMREVEDTTALHRCGPDGLRRLRQDGARIEALCARGEDPRPLIDRLNAQYRAIRLTMGGVADCMALVFSLAETPAARIVRPAL